MEEQPTFNGDRLRYKSLEDYAAFKDLYDFVSNKTAVKSHLESYDLYVIDPSLHDEGTEDMLREEMSSGVFSALNHFGGHTIISLCTTYELAAREFLFCFFIKNPSHIYEFIGPEDARGHVSLKEVLKVNSYQDLLISLAKKAAAVASKGKYGQVLARIANLCKEDIDKHNIKKLDKLQNERNKIVHEKFSKKWELSDIQETENLISAIIEEICQFGLNNNIPGNYTCISNENTLHIQSVAGLTNEQI
jgi:hypothetical protein